MSELKRAMSESKKAMSESKKAVSESKKAINESGNATHDSQHSRRNFIRNSGVALTAALTAGAVDAGTAPVHAAARGRALLEASNAIRALQQRCFALLEQGATRELSTLFSDSSAQANCVYPSMQLDSRLDTAAVEIDDDQLHASARFHGRVYIAMLIDGDGTAQQMARLQGLSSTQWWEEGVYDARYVNVDGEWKISALSYRKA
jgi:hypothetical protein